MVGGVVPWSSKDRIEAKRAPRRSAFSIAMWTKMSLPVRSGVSENELEEIKYLIFLFLRSDVQAKRNVEFRYSTVNATKVRR